MNPNKTLRWLGGFAWRCAAVATGFVACSYLLVLWAAHKPTVEASGDGHLRLLAEDARLHGPPRIHLEFYEGEHCIGWWDYDTQSLSWKIDALAPGTYAVRLRYSRPQASEVGLRLEIGDSLLEGRVGGTGSWAAWDTRDLGSIEIDGDGGHKARLSAFDTRGEEIINFVFLELAPQ